MICGGIDVGGTKIEARLFSGPSARTEDLRRIPTPTDSFAAMIAAIGAQAAWLGARSGQPGLPIGVAVPGIVDPETGRLFAANLPRSEIPIIDALADMTGRAMPFVNDCMAFAVSEARGGAGEGHRRVLGLILGTGVGGGLCVDGALPHRHGGLAVEIGHAGASARAIARNRLPLLPCGCGAVGCVETYVSGTGLRNLAEIRTGRRIPAEQIAADPAHAGILDLWADMAGDALALAHLTLAPDCIVLGGGLSNLPGVAARLAEALGRQRLGTTPIPAIVTARHGDSSGARGAALLAASC